MDLVGYSMSKRAADEAFAQAGFKPGEGRDQVGVLNSVTVLVPAMLITYDALGLCKKGEAHKLVEGDSTYGGKWVINPSGGLEAKGHPLGASGLATHFISLINSRTRRDHCKHPAFSTHLTDRVNLYGLYIT